MTHSDTPFASQNPNPAVMSPSHLFACPLKAEGKGRREPCRPGLPSRRQAHGVLGGAGEADRAELARARGSAAMREPGQFADSRARKNGAPSCGPALSALFSISAWLRGFAMPRKCPLESGSYKPNPNDSVPMS